MSEADAIVVLDTGSTDDSVSLLRSLGCTVEQKIISPWRFDAARNESMKLIPPDADLCVCTDLDEVFLPGWRKALEAAFAAHPEATTARYEYIWDFALNGADGRKFLYEKVHRPGICRWTHPVHEVLEYAVPKVYADVSSMRLEHHPDSTKSRASYLELLELSVRECPEDDRNVHYLGREYMFRGRWGDAILTLRRHLALPSATWKPERAASMRYIARCYQQVGDLDRAELWLRRAVDEAPEQREAAVELEELAYTRQDWRTVVCAGERAVSVRRRDLTYLTEAEAWGSKPWDLLSLGYWYTGEREKAAGAIRAALRLAPGEKRLKNNLRLMGDAP